MGASPISSNTPRRLPETDRTSASGRGGTCAASSPSHACRRTRRNQSYHIVGLRPFGSQLLCEQVVGRAPTVDQSLCCWKRVFASGRARLIIDEINLCRFVSQLRQLQDHEVTRSFFNSTERGAPFLVKRFKKGNRRRPNAFKSIMNSPELFRRLSSSSFCLEIEDLQAEAFERFHRPKECDRVAGDSQRSQSSRNIVGHRRHDVW